jgi:hypothetical protein
MNKTTIIFEGTVREIIITEDVVIIIDSGGERAVFALNTPEGPDAKPELIVSEGASVGKVTLNESLSISGGGHVGEVEILSQEPVPAPSPDPVPPPTPSPKNTGGGGSTTPPAQPAVTAVSVTPSTVSTVFGTAIIGEQLTAAVSVTAGASQDVTWVVYDEGTTGAGMVTITPGGILSVDAGADLGTAIIRAVSVFDQTKFGTCTVTVNPLPITSADITVTQPVKGNSPVTTAGGSGNFSVGAVSWTPGDANFLGGKAYTATVTLTAEANYTFTGLTAATIDGQSANISGNTGGQVTLSYTFPALPEKDVASVAVTTQPGSLTYTHGQTLNLAGLAVTVTYTDTSAEVVPFSEFASKGVLTNPANGYTLVRSTHNATSVEVSFGGQSANTSNLTVNPLNVSGGTVGPFAAITYNGLAQTPSAAVTINGLTATGTWSAVTNVTDMTTFTGTDNFTGTIAGQNPNMQRLNVSTGTSGAFTAMTYNGLAQTPSAAVTVNSLTATGTWSAVTNVADTADFTGNGNFTGTLTGQATGMSRLNVGTGTVGAFTAMTYNGAAQTPSATVTISGLTATGTWSAVTNVADTTTFTGTVNFTGTIAGQNPGMARLDVGTGTVGAFASITYNGLAQTPSATVTVNGLTATGTWSAVTDVTDTTTFTATGNFIGTLDNRNPNMSRLDVSTGSSGGFTAMTYTGLAQTPSAAVTVNGLTATGTWSAVTNVADTADFTGNGNFTGTLTGQATGMLRRAVTITGFNITKAFNGTNAVDGFGTLSFTGLQNGESANVSTAGVTATYSQALVGTGLAITFGGSPFAMTGGTAIANNYTITQPTGITGAITQATPVAPNAPPSYVSRTHNYVSLNPPAAGDPLHSQLALEYSRSDAGLTVPNGTWQDGLSFSGLIPGTTYTFFARYKADATKNIASNASEALTLTTYSIPIPANTDFVVSNNTHTYNRSVQGADVAFSATSGSNGPLNTTTAGTITVYYEGTGGTTYTRSTTAPTNAGDYDVLVTTTGGTAYQAIVIGEIMKIGELTISKATLTITPGAPVYSVGSAITPMTAERTATVALTTSGLITGDNVTVGIEAGNGLSISGTPAFANTSMSVTITYNGTTAVTTTTVAPAFTIGGAAANNYTLSGTPSVNVNIFDGQAAARAIPIDEDNIRAFNAFANTTDGRQRHYILTENVTLTSANWTAINTFSGSFNGGGHAITGLTSNQQGMFNGISAGGAVRNLGLVDITITNTSANSIGSIAGSNSGTITDCFVTGSVTGGSLPTDGIGGIAGRNSGTIERCYVTASVHGNSNGTNIIGGVAGAISGSTVRNSVALNSSVVTNMGNSTAIARVTGAIDTMTRANNHACGNMTMTRGGNVQAPTSSVTGRDGATVNPATYNTQAFWTGTMGWDFTGTWKWCSVANLPVLINFDGLLPLIRPSNFNVTNTTQAFNGDPRSVTVAYMGGPVVGTAGAITVWYEGMSGTTYTRSQTAPTNAGTYRILVTTAGGTPYRAVTTHLPVGTLTITATPLTIAMVNHTKGYDRTTAATGATVTFTGGTPANVTIGIVTAQYVNANVGSNINVTAVALTGTAAGNYTVTPVTNFAVTGGGITPKDLTITGVTATNRVYDATTSVTISGGTLVGVEGGDTVTPVVPAIGTANNMNFGNNKPVTVGTITLTGTQAGNYTLTQPTDITVNITQRPLTITFSGGTVISRPFNGTNEFVLPTGSEILHSGHIGSDNPSLSTFFNGGTARIAAGHDYFPGDGKPLTDINITFSAPNAVTANYTIVQPTGITLNVTAAQITVTPAAPVYASGAGTLTPLAGNANRQATVPVEVTGVVAGYPVTLGVNPHPTLGAVGVSGELGVFNTAGTSTNNLTITYNGTADIPNPTVGIRISNTNPYYTIVGSTSTPDVTVQVRDGRDNVNRWIPIAQGNLQAFNTFATGNNGRNYRLVENVDASGFAWTSIAGSFTGSFDGQGNSITGLNANNNLSTRGMFNQTAAEGVVRNVSFINVNMFSSAATFGVVTGWNEGTIENIFVSGSITGRGEVGGIAGISRGIIRNCYVVATVTATAERGAGGIAGLVNNAGRIQNCYAMGSVTGTPLDVGGLVGAGTGTIENSVALNPSISSGGRIGSPTNRINNHARNDMTVGGGPATSDGPTGIHGVDVAAGTGAGQYNNQAFWTDTMGWDFTGTWEWCNVANLPVLINFDGLLTLSGASDFSTAFDDSPQSADFGDNGECDNGECDNGECDNGECDNGECDNGECGIPPGNKDANSDRKEPEGDIALPPGKEEDGSPESGDDTLR